METAGKQVDDEELRDLMKANGIGRPSTRANIIETLFRRQYSVRKKKQVHPTSMGIKIDWLNSESIAQISRINWAMREAIERD